LHSFTFITVCHYQEEAILYGGKINDSILFYSILLSFDYVVVLYSVKYPI
jgi:hypothetical protein